MLDKSKKKTYNKNNNLLMRKYKPKQKQEDHYGKRTL